MEVRKFEARGRGERFFEKRKKREKEEEKFCTRVRKRRGRDLFPPPLPSAADYFALAGLVRINLIARLARNCLGRIRGGCRGEARRYEGA